MKVVNVAVAVAMVSLAACATEVDTEQDKTDDQDKTEAKPAEPQKPVATAGREPNVAPAKLAPQIIRCQPWGCGANHSRRLVEI